MRCLAKVTFLLQSICLLTVRPTDHNPIPSSYVNFDHIGPAFGQFGETLQHEVEKPSELGLPDSYIMPVTRQGGQGFGP